jgi:hypothetical protein
MTTVRHRRRSAVATNQPESRSTTTPPADRALTWTKDLALAIEYRPLESLKPAPRNARTHSKKQIQKIAASIREFGFINPILVDEDDRIVAGHGRLEAARQLGLARVPTIELAHLTEAQRRAYIIADNRLAELAGWDTELLALELKELSGIDLDFEVEIAPTSCRASTPPTSAPSSKAAGTEICSRRCSCGSRAASWT